MSKIASWFKSVWRKFRYGGPDLADQPGNVRAQSQPRIPPNQRMTNGF
jgi:hypothetical protein